MFRLFQHLLPRALAWRTTVDTTLRRYFVGLGGFAGEVRTFIDLVYLDLFPGTTRELPQWEDQFALVTDGSETTRRARVAAAWQAQGGQSPDYIETQLQLAGFAIWIHEWWESGPPYVVRDPRDYTSEMLLGFYQCEGSTPWECFDSGPGDQLAPHCDDTLVNDPGYIVNLDLTRRAPPPIPSNPAFWPYFLYFGGETFPDLAYIEEDRLDELKAKILELRPSQQWVVLIVETFATGLLYRFTLGEQTTYEAGTEDDLRRIASQPNAARLGGSSVQATSASRPVATTFPEGRVAYFDGAQNIASDLPPAAWNALHNSTGVVTIALTFRVKNAVGISSLLSTSGATALARGIEIAYYAGSLFGAVIGNGGGGDILQIAGQDTATHTVVIVKNGADMALYFDDMATPADEITLSAPSDGDATTSLRVGARATGEANAWIPEVLIYDFAATEDQRDAIAAHLAKWTMAPTQAEYIDTMAGDGLAHFFDGDDVAGDASTWADAITLTNMTTSSLGGGSSRAKGTLDGHAALVVDGYSCNFNAAAALAAGTDKAFTVFLYGQFPLANTGQPPWQFWHPGGGGTHRMAMTATTIQVDRSAGGGFVSSATLTRASTDRFYSHVFRAASDGANLVRLDGASTAPALAVNPMSVVSWQMNAASAGAASFAFVSLYDRALNEGDLQALYQVIEREL